MESEELADFSWSVCYVLLTCGVVPCSTPFRDLAGEERADNDFCEVWCDDVPFDLQWSFTLKWQDFSQLYSSSS
jgi:hypothetical protein